MLSGDDLLSRIQTVKNLKENCFKYLESSSSELLTHKIIFALAKLTSEKMGPVKLGEIAEKLYKTNDKSKQDLIRVTMESSLMKCGMVEKLRYSTKDVRYVLTGYRFQKIRKIDSFRDTSSEKIGEIFELPKSTWPIPDEFFFLKSQKSGYVEALKIINSDFDSGLIQRGKYEDLIRELTEKLDQLNNQIHTKFNEIEELVNISS